jgi:transketolase
MPSTSVFDRQDSGYRLSVLTVDLPRVAVEAGSTRLWAAYGCGAVLGLDRFGESAPGPELMKALGFTPEHLVSLVVSQVEREPQIERSSN